MTIGDLLDPGAVALRAGAPGKRQALSMVADVAARILGVDGDALPHAGRPGGFPFQQAFQRRVMIDA